MRNSEEIEAEIEEIEAKIEELERGDNEEAYKDYLSDVYGDVDICGLKYDAGLALKRVDEIAFNCGLNDWNDGEISELNDKLDGLKDELKAAKDEEAELDLLPSA